MRFAPVLFVLAACSSASAKPNDVATTDVTPGTDPTTAAPAEGTATETTPGAPAAGAAAGAAAATTACLPLNVCDAPALDFKPRGFKNASTNLIVAMGAPQHRGRDLFITPGAPQNILGKFTYGVDDKDIHHEEVDLFVQRDCASGWEQLGTAITTNDGEHATVEGVEDNGGRVYFEIPAEKALGPGRHRIRMVVAGDGTSTDSFLDIVPAGTPIFLSDVDGTLTSSEDVIVSAVVTGKTPETHPGAADAFQALVAKGYRALYLTARPEFLTAETRQFLKARGFPEGLVETASASLGAGSGDSAAAFKTSQFTLLAAKGLTPIFAFGNMPSDSQAYTPVVDPQRRIFYQIEGDFTGRDIQSYEELVPEFKALAPVCTAK